MAKTKPESRVMARSFQVGIGGLLVIALLTYLTLEAQWGNPFSSNSYVKAVFHDVHALQLKDPVRQNSKGIGRVVDIAYQNGAAVVTLQIEEGGDFEVYRDATAFIGDQSAVGSKFVGLYPGNPASGPLPDNTIPESRTKQAHDISEVLNIFDPTTRERTGSFLREFGGGMTGQADGFREFVHNAPADLNGLGTMSTALASKEANLPALLESADRLSNRFHGREAEIASLINQTEATFSAVSVDHGKPLGDLLAKTPDTLARVTTATDALASPLADTRRAMTELRDGAHGLGEATPDLRGTLTEAVPVLDKVPDVADQVTPAFDDLTPALHDVRPLAPRVTEFLDRFATPLRALAPYGKEVGYLFVRGRSFTSEGTANGVHYARFNAGVGSGPYTATGGVLKACDFQVNAYPKPGEADRDGTKLGVQNTLPCGLAAKGLGQNLGGGHR